MGEGQGVCDRLHLLLGQANLRLRDVQLQGAARLTRIGCIPGEGRPLLRTGGPMSYAARPSPSFQPDPPPSPPPPGSASHPSVPLPPTLQSLFLSRVSLAATLPVFSLPPALPSVHLSLYASGTGYERVHPSQKVMIRLVTSESTEQTRSLSWVLSRLVTLRGPQAPNLPIPERDKVLSRLVTCPES